MRVSVLCGMLLLSSALAAQTSAGSGSSGPHILIDTVGPEGWRTRLGPTNLGSMLESERGRQLWQPMVVPMLTHWERQLGDKTTYDAARACLLGYSGRVRAGIWLEGGGGDLPCSLLCDRRAVRRLRRVRARGGEGGTQLV